MTTDAQLRGAVLLELFDAETGKKVDESGGENYITPAGLDYARWAVREVYAKSMPTGNDFDYTLTDPFSTAYLTDSDTQVDVNSSQPEGVLVGWAGKSSYSGSDTKQGALNLTESDATLARAKWVFDWATTAANGTIRSVGFCPGASTSRGLLFFDQYSDALSGIPANFPSTSTNGLVLLPSGEVASTTSPFNRYDPVTGAYLGQWGPTGAQADPTWSGFSGAAHDGTSMWVASNGTHSYLRKFNIPAGTGAVSATSVGVPGATSLRGVAYDGSHLWVISDTENILVRIDKNTGAVDRQFNIPNSTLSGTRNLTFNPHRGTLLLSMANLGCYEYDLNGVQRGQFAYYTLQSQVYNVLALGNDFYWMSGYTGNSNTSRRGKGIVGSRIVLPSAVTKTNLQTMKLTYTFTYA